MTDRIELKGIRGFGFHGVLDFERKDGQEFIVDVALRVETHDAAAIDDLTLTVDYGVAARLVHDHIIGEPHLLIETLAHRIGDALMRIPGVLGATVSVHKPHAPIPVPFDDVIVTIHKDV